MALKIHETSSKKLSQKQLRRIAELGEDAYDHDFFGPRATLYRLKKNYDHVVVASLGEKIIGYAQLNRYGKIGAIAVDPEHWNEGIGSKIIQKTKEKRKQVIIETRADDQKMSRVLKKQGFKKAGGLEILHNVPTATITSEEQKTYTREEKGKIIQRALWTWKKNK